MKTLILLLVAVLTLNAMDENKNFNTKDYGSMDTPQPEWVDTHGLGHEEVLQALYKRAKPNDSNNINDSDTLDAKQIQMIENKGWKVGRLKEKSLHVDLSYKNRFDAGYYNQVNGKNVAQEAIEQLKKQKNNDSVDKK